MNWSDDDKAVPTKEVQQKHLEQQSVQHQAVYRLLRQPSGKSHLPRHFTIHRASAEELRFTSKDPAALSVWR